MYGRRACEDDDALELGRQRQLASSSMSARPNLPAELLGAIYEAAMEPSCWTAVVEQATTWVGGVAGSFQARSLGPEPKPWMISTGIDPALQAAYLTHYYKNDPHLSHIDRLAAHSTLLSSDIIDDSELRRTEYYDGFYLPQRFRDLQGVVLIKNENWMVSLAMFAEQRFDGVTRAKLDALAPHFTRALKLAFRFDTPPALDHAVRAASSCGALALVHVDASLALVDRDVEDPARDWLRDVSMPVFVADGRLMTRLPSDTDKLARAVELALAGEGGAVTFGPPHAPLVLGFAPAAQRHPFGTERCVMVLFLTGPRAESLLANAFGGLPATLQEVARRLARGASDKDIAHELGYSVATARTYTSRVLARLGLRDRRELIKLR
jgi:DNA-binding CsgD family transcriptional regulator